MSDKVKGVVVKAGTAIDPAKSTVKSTAVKPAAKSEKKAPAKVETPVDQTEVDTNDEDIVSKVETPVDQTEADGNDEDIVSKVSSECPAFLTGWNPKEADCMTCATDFPVEYAECEKVCTADKAASPKGKIKASGKKKGENTTARKVAGPRSRYGHYIDTRNSFMDNLVWEGGKLEDMVKKTAAKFEKDETKTQVMLRGHFRYLIAQKGIVITEKDGIIKAETEFMKGFDATTSSADTK